MDKRLAVSDYLGGDEFPVGYNDDGEINNVHIESGELYGGDYHLGGLVGYQAGGKIINSVIQIARVEKIIINI